MFRRFATVFSFFFILQLQSFAQSVYMTIEGEIQGTLSTGSSSLDSIGSQLSVLNVDSIIVLGYTDEIKVIKDPITDLPTGQIYGNLSITKPVDNASPLLRISHATGEKFSEIELTFYRTTANDGNEHYFTVLYEDCEITDINSIHDNFTDKDIFHYEEVRFYYTKASRKHEITGPTALTNWEIHP